MAAPSFGADLLSGGGLASAFLRTTSDRGIEILLAVIWPGVALGRWLVQRVRAQVFERVILGLLVIGAVHLPFG